MMTDSSADQKDETKPVLGYPQSGQFPQHDPNFVQNYYSNPGYPYQYPPFYYYPPNCQSNYCENTNNINNTLQPQLSNVAHNTPPKRKLFTFPRILCCLLFMIISFIIVSFVVLWYNNIVTAPRFKVVSFVVHSFEISNSSMLRARWDIDVNVNNPNREADVRFEHIANSLTYKFALLETSFSTPFSLEKNSRKNFRAEFDIPSSSHKKMGGLKVYDMAKERDSKGKLYFDLKITAKIFSQRGKGRKTLYLYCEDLGLVFTNSSSSPKWDGDTVRCSEDDNDDDEDDDE